MREAIDYNALSWVRQELAETLKQARHHLEEYATSKSKESLQDKAQNKVDEANLPTDKPAPVPQQISEPPVQEKARSVLRISKTRQPHVDGGHVNSYAHENGKYKKTSCHGKPAARASAVLRA